MTYSREIMNDRQKAEEQIENFIREFKGEFAVTHGGILPLEWLDVVIAILTSIKTTNSEPILDAIFLLRHTAEEMEEYLEHTPLYKIEAQLRAARRALAIHLAEIGEIFL